MSKTEIFRLTEEVIEALPDERLFIGMSDSSFEEYDEHYSKPNLIQPPEKVDHKSPKSLA